MPGQVIKRGNGWLIRVYLGRDPISGKRTYRNQSVRGGTKKEANQVLVALLRQRDTGDLIMAPTLLTVEQYLEEWKEKALRPRVKARTFESYEGMLRRYVVPEIGKRKLVQVTPMDMQDVIAAMVKRGLSARTVRYTHAVINNAMRQAVRWRLLRYNPAQDVQLPKRVHREMRSLTREEAQRFLAAAESSPHYLLFAVLLGTGMRPGEAVALKWGDLDATGRQLSIQRSASYAKTGPLVSEPKTARARRKIELPEHLAYLLSVRRGDAAADELVFPTKKGPPMDVRSLASLHFKPTLERAGLPRETRLYDLRHTQATLLLAAGEHPKIVSERLGHASVSLTLDVYSHVLPGMQAESARKLDALLFGGASEERTGTRPVN